MKPIGHIRSEFSEKFGIPKQPGLAPSLRATLVLEGEWAHETCWRGLEDCSHLWVIFEFHASEKFQGGTVRPPVLGGTKRMGVFSTRSPHRPNPIGLSLVKRGAIEQRGKETHIVVEGHDFLDGTPLLDIKPFVASYDQPRTPAAHWSDQLPAKILPVCWSTTTGAFPHELRHPVEEILSLDPRPRTAQAGAKFGIAFAGWNVVFSVANDTVMIEEVSPETSSRIK